MRKEGKKIGGAKLLRGMIENILSAHAIGRKIIDIGLLREVV
jgi:hypothetical protein